MLQFYWCFIFCQFRSTKAAKGCTKHCVNKMVAGETARWHHKWVVFLLVLGWLFLYRYRVMGYLLSKAIAYQLSKSHLRNSMVSPITVRVERVSLQPLRFMNIELSSRGSTCWRIVLTKLEVQSHVKEFFESFGHVKICILIIDEVIGNVDQIDDKVLRAILMPNKVVAKNAAQMRSKVNPVCYLRFVDLKIVNIRLRVDCLKSTTTLLCQGLYVGIIDVFVARDLMRLKAQANSLIIQSAPQADGRNLTNCQSDGSDGLRVQISETSAVLSLDLRNHSFLGCKLIGYDDHTATIVMSTAYLEQTLAARNELFRMGVVAASEAIMDPLINDPRDHKLSAATSLEVELNDFHLSITFMNEVDFSQSIPLQLLADIRKIFYRKKPEPRIDVGLSNELPTDPTTDALRIQVEVSVQRVQVRTLASNQNILSLCCIEVQAKQTTKTRGILMGTIVEVSISLSHQTDECLRYFLALHERLHRSQIEAKETLTHTLLRHQSDGRPVLPNKSIQIYWESEIKVTKWLLSFKAFAKDGATHDLTANGSAASIQTPLAPVLREDGCLFIKRSIVLQRVSIEVQPSGYSPHLAVLEDVKLTQTASVDPSETTKSLETSAHVKFVSINHLRSGKSDEFCRFPALYIDDFKISRSIKETTENLEKDLAIYMDRVVIKWHYQHHRNFLIEWAAIETIVSQLELLLVKPSAKNQNMTKILSTNIFSKYIAVDVTEISGIAPLSSFCLVETKLSHRATRLCATVALSSANASVRWGEMPSVITFVEASIQHRHSLGRQRYLSKVPIQSDIRCGSMKMHLRPNSQMLLLVIRIDQMIATSSDKHHEAKESSAHGISFVCGTIHIDMEESNEYNGSIELDSFDVKMTRCTPRETTETMVRLLQCLTEDGLAGRSFEEMVQQVQLLEGTVSASTISATTSTEKPIKLQNTKINFAITDVEWSRVLIWDKWSTLPRSTSFDVSILIERIDVMIEKQTFYSLLRVLPILQQALDTKGTQTHEITESVSKQPNFLQRLIGHIDIAFQYADLSCPLGDKDVRDQRSGSKLTRVLVGELAFNLRQFQTLGFRCSPLRVILESADQRDSDDRYAGSLQVLFVPKITAGAVIHWQHPIQCVGQLQYALSLDISIGHTNVYESPVYVPIADEALMSLDWDCVVPWLVEILIDDACNDPIQSATKKSPEIKQTRCVGVQWDVSVQSIQFVWWDTMTQETGMLIVANEFLTHGVVRLDDLFDLEQEKKSQWKLWETTVYLHLLRGYLLHADDDADIIDNDSPATLPFRSEIASNFSMETIGTSYRNAYTPNADEDWETLDEQVTSMFAPSTVTLFDKMHDTFEPIDYDFSIADTFNLAKSEPSVQRLPMLHVPLSIRSSSSTSPRLKSPRSDKNWMQTIKNRLSRLKRRSASMDNLFLTDGSCPIQVDAMRLLWTLQTRDSVFYMVSTTISSLRLLLDAKQYSGIEDGQRRTARSASLSPLRRAKGSSSRSPSLVETGFEIDHDFNAKITTRESRRGSARDTLLELLQQGKLGVTQDVDLSLIVDEETESARATFGEDASDCDDLKATIAIKAYTVDIHDVQINVREENTRSNVLLASKHIHFEIGTDVSDMNTIANLTFDNVTAHVAPIDVDISAGVLWYSHADVGSPSAPGSALLKQIMEECSLTSSYNHAESTGITSTLVDLSFLELSTDRHQFYQLINVIRHVLLAPPSIARRTNRTFTTSTNSINSTQQVEESDLSDWLPPIATTTSLAGSTSIKKLHVLLEEELRNREIRTRGTMSRSKWAMTAVKAITFKVVGMQWKLRLSPELTDADHEFVGIRIQGFTGCHSYFTNHCTKLTLNLQWLEIINLHPGPSSAAFKDSSAVLKAKLLVDKRFESAATGIQKGMLVVRAESGPIVRIYGQKLRVLELLEVSMFPEVANIIVIQLAADFYELIYKFFFENITPASASSQNTELFFGQKSTFGPVTSSSMSSLSQKGATSPFAKSRAPQSISSSQNTFNTLRKSNSAGPTNSMQTESSTLSTAQTSLEEVLDVSESAATDDFELFYVKYVRVGNVRLQINCNGFFVNLSHFDLELPPYVCQSKLCTSKKLLQKFESHLKWYITKESASSGLSQFKNKLLKWTPSSSLADGKKDKSNKRQEEDTAAANAQVLFGPYSGT
ncbi:hypothetical protein Plhal703r1_c16g0076951 [Plasmopara halstedii]